MDISIYSDKPLYGIKYSINTIRENFYYNSNKQQTLLTKCAKAFNVHSADYVLDFNYPDLLHYDAVIALTSYYNDFAFIPNKTHKCTLDIVFSSKIIVPKASSLDLFRFINNCINIPFIYIPIKSNNFIDKNRKDYSTNLYKITSEKYLRNEFKKLGLTSSSKVLILVKLSAEIFTLRVQRKLNDIIKACEDF